MIFPSLTEEVVPVEMDHELAGAYHELENKVGSAMREMLVKGSRKLLGTYLNSLLCYPDRPFQNEPIIYPGTDRIIAQPAQLPENRIYGKEHHLLNIVSQEISQGRRCFVYACTLIRGISRPGSGTFWAGMAYERRYCGHK